MSLNLTKIKDLENGNMLVKIERNEEIEELEIKDYNILKSGNILITNRWGREYLITDEEEEY